MRKFIKTCLVCALSLSLSGCVSRKTQIAYTAYPVGYLANRIVADKLQVVSIQNNEIIQRSTMTMEFRDILANSAVLFHIGTVEPYLDMYAVDIKNSKVDLVDLSRLNAIYKFQRYTKVITDGQEQFIEQPYYKGIELTETLVDDRDLYLWTDPIAMLSMGKTIRNWCIDNFPEETKVFNDNFNSLENDLVRLDAEYQAMATRITNEKKEIKFVSMTASFGNWQKTYGIQVYPVIMSKYGTLPTAAQLSIIKDRIKQDNVKYIVYEPNMSEEMIDLFNTLQDELKLKRVNLNNASSLTESQLTNNKDYLSMMYENLSVLETMATEIPVLVDAEEVKTVTKE